MKKFRITLFIIITANIVFAQEVISTQGDSYSNSSISLDFTIGELIVETGTEETNDITQGFHQTNWFYVSLDDLSPIFDVNIFPNPTEDVLNIKIGNFEKVFYSVFNIQGKLLLNGVLVAEQTTIQVSPLPVGTYLLTLLNDSPNLKTFTLIKTH